MWQDVHWGLSKKIQFKKYMFIVIFCMIFELPKQWLTENKPIHLKEIKMKFQQHLSF